MNYDEFLLRPHPFLTGMCESHLRLLADNARQVHFTAGSRIFHEGDLAEHFYLIERGKVVLQAHSAGQSVPIQTIGSGEVLGWSWLFPPYCWHFDARAEEDTDAISFPAARLRDDCEIDKTFGYALMKQIAELLIHRLQATRLKLVQAHKIERHAALPIGRLNMNTLESIIATHPFTKDINPRFLHLLNECATFERFGAGQQIFQESFEADRFYLIHRGRVALQTFVPGTGVTTIQTVGAGEALGWSWLYPPYRWHFSAAAVEPVEAAGLCARTLRDRMQENHEFGYEIALRVGQTMLERLQSTRLRLLEMYGVPG